MDIQRRFPGLNWMCLGGTSFIYEVHPLIVVKIPRPGEEEKAQFLPEVNIYKILSQHRPWLSIVQCFFYTNDGIFLEYMRDTSLFYRIEDNRTRDLQNTMRVISVKCWNLSHSESYG